MEPTPQSKRWIRLACIGLTAVGLGLVFMRVNFSELGDTFRGMRPLWFAVAVVVYGLLFIPAAVRLHLIFTLAGIPARPLETFRTCLIGHLFYVVLFGAVGGDTARSAWYARQQRVAFAEILATAPLDRLLGTTGLMLFVGLSFALATAGGAFSRMGGLQVNLPAWWWLIIGLILAALVWRFLRKANPHSFAGRFTSSLLRMGKLLVTAPGTTLAGVLCGFCVQIALSGALALSLQSVSHSPLPWGQLVWTLPIISLASSFPLSVAGAGPREGTALALLGLYGIPAADAVAASLLTMVAILFWAGVGGLLLWTAPEPASEPASPDAP